jgi:WXG100 family type VII secretion target
MRYRAVSCRSRTTTPS